MFALLVLLIVACFLFCGFLDGFGAEAAGRVTPMVVSYAIMASLLFILVPLWFRPLYCCFTAATGLGIVFGVAHGRWVRRKLGGKDGKDE